MRHKLIYAAVALAAASASLTCSPGYVLRAGIEEGRILARRRPIADVIADPSTTPELRRKLELVVRARTFAAEMLRLDVGDSYTTYSWIDRDTLALVLSAAHRDRLEPVTWWFPIVGRVPYKGFFDPERALSAARDLERRGFDTYVRPTSAFSTLGWFNDPLLSTITGYDDVHLVATVIHELTHNTLYLPGEAGFNESFASFVGDRGAAEYFCSVEGPGDERCRRALDEWHDTVLFGRFLETLLRDLAAVYAAGGSSAQRVERRDSLFADARERFDTEVAPDMRAGGFRWFSRVPLNNARLLAWRLYYDRLHAFEGAYQRLGGDLPRTVAEIVRVAPTLEDPFEVLGRL